jgi:predicted porin
MRMFIILAACAAGVSAHAQSSSVTISGYADASFVYEKGAPAGSDQKVMSGVSGPSRFIFRGSEDLGGGLTAFFHLEHGVTYDNGGSPQQNFWGRQSFIGLRGNTLGNLQAGLIYTTLLTTVRDVVDPFKVSFVGAATNIFTGGAPGAKGTGFPNPGAANGTVASGGTSRANTLQYSSPKWAGFSGDLAWSFGEKENNKALRTVVASAGYGAGPLNMRVAHGRTNNAAASDTSRNTVLGANYDFRVLKIHLGYGHNKGYGVARSDDMLVGVSVPVGQGVAMASYATKNDKSAQNIDAAQAAVGCQYFLSKRTSLHASMAHMSNDAPNTSPAFYTVSSPAGRSTADRAFAIGMGHAF